MGSVERLAAVLLPAAVVLIALRVRNDSKPVPITLHGCLVFWGGTSK